MWTQYNSAGQTVSPQPISNYPISYAVISGATDSGPGSMAAGNVLIVWTSTSGVTKRQTIPTSVGTNNKITVVDGVTPSGSAGTYNIILTPTAGSLVGSGIVNIINVNLNSITLTDSPVGWVAV